MPETGIEPVRGLARRILSPVRLPVPPLGHISHNDLLLNHYNTPFDLGQHLFFTFLYLFLNISQLFIYDFTNIIEYFSYNKSPFKFKVKLSKNYFF